MITKKTIDHSTEDKVIIGMIMSDKFIREVIPIYKKEYLTTSFAKIICDWALDYYQSYEKAPKFHIQDIFDVEKEYLEETDKGIIEKLLGKLSKQYTEEQEINDDYFIDTAMELFKKRDLEIIMEKMTKLLTVGKVDEAEHEIVNYKKVAKQTSEWFNPFDDKNIVEVFENFGESLIDIPGDLGRFIGNLERGWLISIVGAFKRGKSFAMQELAMHGLLSKLKVVIISMEMNKKNIDKRIFSRVTSLSTKGKEIIIPCFDCAINQDNSCTNKNRTSKIGVEDVLKYTPNLEYAPCTYCRGKEEYVLSTWFEPVDKEEFNLKNTRKILKRFKTMWGDNLRVITHPRFSASLSDIKRHLDLLAYTEDFVPDIIVPDYAGIIKPEKNYSKDYQALDDVWKGLAGLAEERHCLVVTGAQINRTEMNKQQMDAEGLAGWIGQAAHLDKAFALNQTKEEKVRGIMRWNKLFDRHEDFNDYETCVVLQNPSIGQIVLDSQIVRF